MQKLVRLLLISSMFFLALFCSQQAIMAEQPKDEYVDELLKDNKKNESEQEDSVFDKNKQDFDKEENPPVVLENDGKIGVTFGNFAKMIISLIFVVGLLYFTLKLINQKSRAYRSSQTIENLGGVNLGANRSIQLVKVADRVLIVGVGETIQLLSEIKNPEEYESIIDEYNNKLEQAGQANDFISRISKKFTEKNNEQSSRVDNSFNTMLENEFKQFRSDRQNSFEEIEKKGNS